ncbi:MAG: hypothetical protein RLZZ360_815 [Candidatus Parcubacteria bacterium]|jgi:hypothetical protein
MRHSHPQPKNLRLGFFGYLILWTLLGIISNNIISLSIIYDRKRIILLAKEKVKNGAGISF